MQIGGYLNIKPMYDRVLLKRKEHEPMSKSGLIHLSQKGRGRTHEAKVIAVGPGKLDKHGIRILPELKVGETVHVGGGPIDREIVIDGETHLMMKESEIMGVVASG